MQSREWEGWSLGFGRTVNWCHLCGFPNWKANRSASFISTRIRAALPALHAPRCAGRPGFPRTPRIACPPVRGRISRPRPGPVAMREGAVELIARRLSQRACSAGCCWAHGVQHSSVRATPPFPAGAQWGLPPACSGATVPNYTGLLASFSGLFASLRVGTALARALAGVSPASTARRMWFAAGFCRGTGIRRTPARSARVLTGSSRPVTRKSQPSTAGARRAPGNRQTFEALAKPTQSPTRGVIAQRNEGISPFYG